MYRKFSARIVKTGIYSQIVSLRHSLISFEVKLGLRKERNLSFLEMVSTCFSRSERRLLGISCGCWANYEISVRDENSREIIKLSQLNQNI